MLKFCKYREVIDLHAAKLELCRHFSPLSHLLRVYKTAESPPSRDLAILGSEQR